MQKSDFKKGQIVCCVNHYGDIIEAIVKSVGTKYITVGFENGADDIKFDINDNFRNTNGIWKLYLSKEDIDIERREYRERAELIKSIDKIFSDSTTYSRLSIEQLKEIKFILDNRTSTRKDETNKSNLNKADDKNFFHWNDTIRKLYDNDK
jgi:hypothetical protein